MITEIGIVAGEIWHALDAAGPCDVEHLCTALERPRELILMSVGWLCREGHVQLVQHHEGYYVSLTKRSEVRQGAG